MSVTLAQAVTRHSKRAKGQMAARAHAVAKVIDNLAERFLKDLSHQERMLVGRCVIESLRVFENVERFQESLRGDKVAQIVAAASADIPSFYYPNVEPLKGAGTARLLAAYAYHCARVAVAAGATPDASVYGLGLANRAIAMAYAIEGVEPAEIRKEAVKNAREVRLANIADVREFARGTYQAKKYHSRRQAAQKMAPVVLAHAVGVATPFSKRNFQQTLYRWLLEDFPKK